MRNLNYDVTIFRKESTKVYLNWTTNENFISLCKKEYRKKFGS